MQSQNLFRRYVVDKIKQNDLQLNNGIMFSHESEFRGLVFLQKITKFLVEYKQYGNINLNVAGIRIERI